MWKLNVPEDIQILFFLPQHIGLPSFWIRVTNTCCPERHLAVCSLPCYTIPMRYEESYQWFRTTQSILAVDVCAKWPLLCEAILPCNLINMAAICIIPGRDCEPFANAQAVLWAVCTQQCKNKKNSQHHSPSSLLFLTGLWLFSANDWCLFTPACTR